MPWLIMRVPLSHLIGLRPNRTERLRARADQRKRANLIAGILIPVCRVCGTTAGAGCNPYQARNAEVVRLDRNPPLFVHSDRLGCAISLGFVSRDLVIAQFGTGTLPDGLP